MFYSLKKIFQTEEEDFNELEESEIVELASTAKLEPKVLLHILNDVKELF